MTTLITVLKGGGRYDATWVARLARPRRGPPAAGAPPAPTPRRSTGSSA